jgi:RHS repeat-associated protein
LKCVLDRTRDVLDTKQNKVGTSVISNYDYAVNAIGQRTGVTTSGTAHPALPSWLWSYDATGNRKKSAHSLSLPPCDNYVATATNTYSSVQSPGAAAALTPGYDDDGNMTSGPLPVSPAANSTLLWDGENRLTEVKNAAGTTLEKNVFDSGSRKIATIVGGVTTLYLYDAWNCIAEYSGTALAKTRLWGTDLSGTPQGAGGVGGLLCESQLSNAQIIHYYRTYDGNGNASEYLTATGAIAAHFEYDPFGNTVVNTDTSNQFAYRFSTKPMAFTTGLYYYGYRYYDPMTGRWPSRDPIGKKGGVNLYGFIKNQGPNLFDYLGLIGGVPDDVLPPDFVGPSPPEPELPESPPLALGEWKCTRSGTGTCDGDGGQCKKSVEAGPATRIRFEKFTAETDAGFAVKDELKKKCEDLGNEECPCELKESDLEAPACDLIFRA